MPNVIPADIQTSVDALTDAVRRKFALTTGIYETTADGLAGTSEGNYFSILAPDPDEYIIIYRHDAGAVATEMDRYPNLAALNQAVAACDADATAAAADAAAALSSKNAAATSAGDALSYQNTALSARDTALSHRDKAQDWSSKGENLVVETGLYSALHHALKAAASAAAAATSEGNAATSETNAAGSAAAALADKNATSTLKSDTQGIYDQTVLLFDNFDDRFLGSFSSASEPTTDNDGQALLVGAIYYNTTETELRFWNGSVWEAPTAAAAASATQAANSASAASTSESNAATSESNAATSAANAATSETNAATSESNAASSAAAAALSYDSFDDRYLGAKATEPATDNDGDALQTGALYWNSTLSKLFVRAVTGWVEVAYDSSNVAITGGSITGVGNMQIDGDHIRITRDAATLGAGLYLHETASALGLQSLLVQYQDNLQFQNRNPDGSFESSLYTIKKNTTGGTLHQWFTQGTEKMRLSELGLLGIGTVTPAYSVDVVGGVRTTGNMVSESHLHAKGGHAYINGAAPGANAHLWLRTDANANRGLLQYDVAGDRVELRKYDAAGAVQTNLWLEDGGRVSTTGNLVAGRDTGSVALTVNDGYGNASVTFNHENGTPQQGGNSGRIEVNVDDANTPTMSFELLGGVTSGVAVQTLPIMTLHDDLAHFRTSVQTNGRVLISSAAPVLDLYDTNANTGYAYIRHTYDGHKYFQMVRDSGGNFVATDYESHIGANGSFLHMFKCGNIEKVRINNSGFHVGTTNGTPGNGNNDHGVVLRDDGTLYVSRNTTSASFNRAGIGNLIIMRSDGGQVGSISVTASSTAYNTSSDYRLKDNVVPLDGAAERVQALKPSRFEFTAEPGVVVDGFIAHEAQAVVPEAVTGEKDAVDADGNPEYQGIDQSKLVPLLTAALQEALIKIEDLEARVTAMEGAA